MVICSGFHGSITWNNMGLRIFSWPICSEPVVSLGVEQNHCNWCVYLSYKKNEHVQGAIGKFIQEVEALISLGCQQKLAHRLDDSAETFFVVIRFVPRVPSTKNEWANQLLVAIGKNMLISWMLDIGTQSLYKLSRYFMLSFPFFEWKIRQLVVDQLFDDLADCSTTKTQSPQYVVNPP